MEDKMLSQMMEMTGKIIETMSKMEKRQENMGLIVYSMWEIQKAQYALLIELAKALPDDTNWGLVAAVGEMTSAMARFVDTAETKMSEIKNTDGNG